MLKLTLPVVCFFTLLTGIKAQLFADKYFNSLSWRMIGPHRGGRTVGACGVTQQPNVFYIGVNNGGVWKTTDYGRTWLPIFDDQSTGSIGDVAVAPSNPNIVYVGSGEGIQRPDLSTGNGIYKSSDAGKTWKHLGLDDAEQIGGLAIDPVNENRVFVAALGHPYGPNSERGVYRTLDGGANWEKVLYLDENTGAIQVAIDPVNPSIIYADMWAGRQGPWENSAWNGPESGLFKSVDGGTTWKKLGGGLPTAKVHGLGRIGFCIAPSLPTRIYATVDAEKQGGIYKSDDGGENWKLLTTDNRYWGRGSDFAELKVDPKNPDILYSANVVTWKSLDGGTTWNALRGAPGGDDYHRLWINPDNTDIILLTSDQGGIVTVNGGQSFSSWYNQPTAQFYHVSADNAFPYNVYSGQQESGSVGIASRGNDGGITFREWHMVGAEEYGYVVADPRDPDIIFGGKLSRYNKRTGQTQNIAPEPVRSGKYRFIRTAPVLFNPIDNKTLYYAGNVLFKTMDGGQSWNLISPDLTREKYDIPSSVGIYAKEDMKTMPRRGVIYTVAPSFKDINTIWCGTDDGLIHITHDGGKHWNNVTPPGMTSWSKVSIMEAGHYDVNTAYAAVNRIRCDDQRPHIYKTTDAGKSWKEIVNGLPNEPINVVKEDPVRKGLLFAGSERAVYVSFDGGEHWQSLRINMPATSIRDLVIKDDDLVVATHGRSFWILDDIQPLRQLDAARINIPVILFKPQNATRVRWNMNGDTPLPQEEPAGQNPPDGALLDYYLDNNASGELVLEILDDKGIVVRKFSSNDAPYPIPQLNIPLYWIRPQQVLSANAGAHRFCWDMKYAPLDILPSYPIAAVYKNTEPQQTSPWVMPGNYIARLSLDGKIYTQSFSIKMDPRVKTTTPGLQQQHDLSMQCYLNRKESMELSGEIHAIRTMLQSQLTNAENSVVNKLGPLEKLAGELENGKPATHELGFAGITGAFGTLFDILQEADMPPTSQVINSFKGLDERYRWLKDNYTKLKKETR